MTIEKKLLALQFIRDYSELKYMRDRPADEASGSCSHIVTSGEHTNDLCEWLRNNLSAEELSEVMYTAEAYGLLTKDDLPAFQNRGCWAGLDDHYGDYLKEIGLDELVRSHEELVRNNGSYK